MGNLPRRPHAPYGPLALLILAALACNAGRGLPGATAQATISANPAATSQPAPTAQSGASATAEPGAATATAAPTALAVATSQPTADRLQLEIVQTQLWADYQENARANVLLRNPYEFPVKPESSSASVFSNSGELLRGGKLYFLDGISGGTGFFLPGETVAANVCFTCEEAVLTEELGSVEFVLTAEDATGQWNYSTAVEATVAEVAFDGDSPTFWANGTVKNNSDSALQRISTRIVVFDEAGNLIGAAEASAWDVGPGATADFSGYGIGQTPAGPFTYEVSALGVNY